MINEVAEALTPTATATATALERPYRGFATLSCFSCHAQKVFLRREVEVRRQWQHCGQAFVNNKPDYYSNTTIHQEEDKEEVDISKATLIWRAIKLPIYSVALIPLTVGSAAAYLQTGMFSAQRYSILLISSVLIITWLNLREVIHLPFTASILSVSLLVGITTALILFCSHFHQIEGDRAVGKISPLVRLGTERGSRVVKWAVTGLYVLTFTFGLSSALPFTCIFLCCLTLPIARLVVSYVEENHNDKQKIFMAKYFCVRLHSLFGTALAAGLVVSRMFPKLSLSSTFGLS